MNKNNILRYFIAVALLLTGSAALYAQTAPVRGTVKLQKADGTQEPIADVVVEAYRTDVDRGKLPSAKTNSRGEFQFAGFPVGQTFALVVSGPTIGPKVEPNVKAGREGIVIIVSEGDGRQLTEAEAREVVKLAASAPEGKPISEEEAKKLQAEYEKKVKEVEEKNARTMAADDTARKAFDAGRAAIDAKNWDLAVSKFDEGIAAVPNFVGSTPVMYAAKMVAIRNRGYNSYVDGARQTDAAAKAARFNEAKSDYHAGLEAYKLGMEVINSAPAPADAKEIETRNRIKDDLYINAIEIHRLMALGGVDTSRAAEAEAIVNEYVAMETDAAKKATALTTLGDILRTGGEFEQAVTAYRKVLEVTPDNNEVMASLGLSLVALGTSVEPANREQLQEGLNFMQHYADTVKILPTDSRQVQEFKQSVKDTVEYLKTDLKMKAQPMQRRRSN